MRKNYIDVAKFLGLLIVMMNHISLQLPLVNFIGGMFFVPIFFVSAGYTYTEKKQPFFKFVIKKIKRLIFPYFGVSLLLFVFFYVKGWNTNIKIGRESLAPLFGIVYGRYSMYKLPVEQVGNELMTVCNSPLWFLPALFLSIVCFECMIRSLHKVKEKQKVLTLETVILLLIGICVHYFCPILLPWSLECIPLFVIYLVCGYFAKELDFVETGLNEKKKLIGMLAMLIFSMVINGSGNISIGNFGHYITLGMINGILSSILLLRICYLIKWPKAIERLGMHTMSIFSWHLFVFSVLEVIFTVFLPEKLLENQLLCQLIKVIQIIGTVVGIEFVNYILSKFRGVLWKRETRG